MPRFVILEHDHPALHWDLMLEAGDALQTWRLAETPRFGAGVDATALPDHRCMYLDYEGPVRGERGTVRRWDAGMFADAPESAPARRALMMNGAMLAGRVRLEQIGGEAWRFEWIER